MHLPDTGDVVDDVLDGDGQRDLIAERGNGETDTPGRVADDSEIRARDVATQDGRPQCS
ncbi:hypothetical protein [Pseudonocardia ammonioxydans]|uniref:hypothetical protein n=1 Tax=Pseudonocardia ammonioxydans TaxID=260086 RepID=UPI001FE371F8|nr:hypothetical protein [Pseudonocardia ammonioxydans]